jgi:hypothetical protein
LAEIEEINLDFSNCEKIIKSVAILDPTEKCSCKLKLKL